MSREHLSQEHHLIESVAAALAELVSPADPGAAIRAAIARLGEGLDAASVRVEVEESEPGPATATGRARYEWHGSISTDGAATGDGAFAGESASPIEAGTTRLGLLRVEPAGDRHDWSAAEKAATRAVAAALAGALLHQRNRDRMRDRLHDLRTPLTAILAVSDIVRRYGARLSHEETGRDMEKIQDQVRTMTRLLDE